MEFVCLRWNQLPNIALYMDQVLLVLNQSLEPLLGMDGITGTMINNYVKMKLAHPAVKKKYDREHMARFAMICLMKKVLSMAEIAAVLNRLLQDHTLETAYDLFCVELEYRLASPEGPDSAACPKYLGMAVRAVACKILLEQCLLDGAAEM